MGREITHNQKVGQRTRSTQILKLSLLEVTFRDLPKNAIEGVPVVRK